MAEVSEKFKRVKYLRSLEKFAKVAISGLKRDDYDEAMFRARIAKNIEILKKVEPVFLDQPYTKALENFVNLLITSESKSALINAANALDKLKNKKTYKKDKHKKNYKEEE